MHFSTRLMTNFVDVVCADADLVEGEGATDEEEFEVGGVGGWLFG